MTGAALRRRLRGLGFRLVAEPLSAVLALLPWSGVALCGRAFGRLAWAANSRERRRMLEHLALAFPDLAAEARADVARACARHHGLNLAENLHLLRRGPARILPRIAVEGWETVSDLVLAGRRILVVTGHCGNWELLPAVLSAGGLSPFGFARGLDDPTLQDAVLRLRHRLGGVTIVRGAPGSARQLRQVLRGRSALVIFIDQDTGVEGTWVPFFGRPAYTPLAAAQLGLRHEMAVVPVFLERLDDATHLCRVRPSLRLPPDAAAATALMTAEIEAQIRRRPEQWVWWHRRWRRKEPSATREAVRR